MLTKKLKQAYDLLYEHFGPQYWWPGDTPFEIIVGAILTQNTNWSNVEKAISNLKSANMLDAVAINDCKDEKLAELIKPAGYFNVKTKRLKNFMLSFISDFNATVEAMVAFDPTSMRKWLLSINGIGPETADSIMLYALGHPIFVIDAYTKRVIARHKFISEEATYYELQELFMDNLELDAKMFNEYHALIVKLCKEFCKTKPLCEKCPLKDWC